MRPLALPLSPTRLGTVLLIANLSGSGRSEMVSLAIPMRLGKRNVTHFLLFDKWGKP